MRNEEQIHHWIDRYLRGELMGEDLDEIRNAIKKDAAFAERVTLHQALMSELQNQRHAELKTAFNKNGSNVKVVGMWASPWLKATAAIFIGFLGIFTILQFYNPLENNTANSESDSVTSTEQKSEKPIDKNKEILIKTDSNRSAEEIDSSRNFDLKESNEIKKFSEPEAPSIGENVASSDEVLDANAKKLTDMRLESEKLEASDDTEVVKDKKLASRVLTLYAVQVPTVRTQPTNAGTAKDVNLSSVQKVGKESKRERRKNRKKQEELEEKNVAELDDVIEDEENITPSKSVTPLKEITLEYWENVLNFKGYTFNSRELKVYGLSTTAPVKLQMHLGNVYFTHANIVYRISPSTKPLKFKQVTDESIKRILLE